MNTAFIFQSHYSSLEVNGDINVKSGREVEHTHSHTLCMKYFLQVNNYKFGIIHVLHLE